MQHAYYIFSTRDSCEYCSVHIFMHVIVHCINERKICNYTVNYYCILAIAVESSSKFNTDESNGFNLTRNILKTDQ